MASNQAPIYPTLPQATAPPQQPPIYNPQPSYPLQSKPNYAPPPAYPAIISSQPIVGEYPTRLRCPNCTGEILTNVHYKAGCLTWAICGGICAAGLAVPIVWLGCQFIPFCVNGCKDVVHTCPNCRAHIGKYDRMG